MKSVEARERLMKSWPYSGVMSTLWDPSERVVDEVEPSPPSPTWASDLRAPEVTVPPASGDGIAIPLPSLVELECTLIDALPGIFFGVDFPEPKRVKFAAAVDGWFVGAVELTLAGQVVQSYTTIFPSEDGNTLWHAARVLRDAAEKSLRARGYTVV